MLRVLAWIFLYVVLVDLLCVVAWGGCGELFLGLFWHLRFGYKLCAMGMV